MARRAYCLLGVLGLLLTAGCEKAEQPAGAASGEATSDEATPEKAAVEPAGPVGGKGFDLENKVVKIGALNDESGPAAAIGKPYALGKRILAAQVNAGGTDILPDGWKVELVEKDHGYNPQRAVQAYNQIKDEVALIATSFGTPNTLPLRPMLEKDQLIALPASLSSEMAAHRSTIPLAASYKYEAMRAMDYVVEQAGEDGKDKIKAAIIYQEDDYGNDGLEGWKAAAEHHGVPIVSEQTVKPGQGDFAAVITGLREAGATHVLLTVLPSSSGKLLGTSAQLQFAPVYIGQTPAWVDSFFSADVIPHAVFKRFLLVGSTPFWGEETPGMPQFMAAYEKYGEGAEPNTYILTSYMQGRYALELVKRAIEAEKPTRAGLFEMVPQVENFTSGDLGLQISTAEFPYDVGNKTRLLAPDFENRSWKVVADYASPQVLGPQAGDAVAEATPTDKALDEAAAEASGAKPTAAAAAKTAAPKAKKPEAAE